MAQISRELHADKPRDAVLASVLADLGPVFQSQGYSIDSHTPEGVTFVRKRTLGRGIIGLLGAEQSVAIHLADEGEGTRITIIGQGPGKLKRAIDRL